MIEMFTDSFTFFCKSASVPFNTLGADRHGSYVWEAGVTDSLNRYLTLSATPVLEPEAGYLCEISIGADDNERYDTRVFWSRFARNSDLMAKVPAGDLRALVRATLFAAWSDVLRLKAEALTECYLKPRLPTVR